jgi:hypothetical protein
MNTDEHGLRMTITAGLPWSEGSGTDNSTDLAEIRF